MAKAELETVEPLVLINDEPVAALEEDRLQLERFAKTVAGAVLGTPGPFTVGVFGEWGQGKTSMLRLARRLVDNTNQPNVTTVWFNAWQFEREEHPIVPLVATIIRELEQKEPEGALHTATRSLIRVLRTVAYVFSAKATLKILGLAEVEVGCVPKEAIEREEALKKQSVDPLLDQSRYYDVFQRLGKLHDADGKEIKDEERPRIIVFVDDLDRCLPDNALHLLESIKLVLGQPGFVFVLAVARRIIESYLDHPFKEKYGLTDYREGRSYLDKMIQLPFPIPSHQARFEAFVKRMLGRKELADVAEAFAPLAPIIGPACDYNPREVVRFFNSLLVDRRIWELTNEDEPFPAGPFAVARSLERRDERTYRTLLHDRELCEYLAKGEGTVRDRLRTLRESAPKEGERMAKAVGEVRYWSEALSDAVTYLLGQEQLCVLLQTDPGREWLGDQAVRDRIEQALQVRRPEAPPTDSAKIVDQAVREALDKPQGQLSPEELASITSLSLSSTALSDLEPLKGLTGLQILGLSATQVTDLGPLKGLTGLRVLLLRVTQASDLEPLRGVTGLQRLDLRDTLVTDLEPLKGLTKLQWLYLTNCPVTNEQVKDLRKALPKCNIIL